MTFFAQRTILRSSAALRAKAPTTLFSRSLTLLRPHSLFQSTPAAWKTATTPIVPRNSLLTAYYRSRQFHSSSVANTEYKISELSDGEYHNVANQTMDAMVEYFEDLGDTIDFPGFDVEYQSGVMTLKLGEKGTYVVNKQPPNKQLWLSSPTSGPKRYDYDAEHKVWFYTRDHHSLHSLLNREISEALGVEVHVPVGEDD
ncbi:Mitochondrial chaperone Frataxin [Actinomortierella wolfii]|nr:Mitochondrial chaperone Frataxin [Actinomortierella wolfii]